MHFNLVLVFFTALVLGLSLFPVFIRLSSNKKIVDKREPRKIHLNEVPTLGGVPIFCLLFNISVYLGFIPRLVNSMFSCSKFTVCVFLWPL